MKKILWLMISTMIIGFATLGVTNDTKGVMIDVRTQAEWDQGHLPQAILIPYQNIASQIASVTTDKDERINLYCRSGRRASIALATLKKLGYRNVHNLGSYDRLKQ